MKKADIIRAYNIYEIDLSTKERLLKELKEKAKIIVTRYMKENNYECSKRHAHYSECFV